jgi:hypothetical protein
MTDLPTRVSKQVADFLAKQPAMARLIFALDATGSREQTWDQACHLQGQMFAEAGKLGMLQIQLVYFRGLDECRASHWTGNASELARIMTGIRCRWGETQIGKILAHIRKENISQKVSAAIFVGDCVEEGAPPPQPRNAAPKLYDASAALGVPLFMFQEGADPEVEKVYREMARLTNGAYCRFEPGAEAKLAELLRAVAAFATGGLTALADQRTDAARLLLGQMKKK